MDGKCEKLYYYMHTELNIITVTYHLSAVYTYQWGQKKIGIKILVCGVLLERWKKGNDLLMCARMWKCKQNKKVKKAHIGRHTYMYKWIMIDLLKFAKMFSHIPNQLPLPQSLPFPVRPLDPDGVTRRLCRALHETNLKPIQYNT